jgi:hypothetical protein
MSHYADYEQDYLRHRLFRAVRAVALERAGNACRRCGGPASQVHHFRAAPDTYPEWGAFDTPSNLEPICEACHAAEHGKPPRTR